MQSPLQTTSAREYSAVLKKKEGPCRTAWVSPKRPDRDLLRIFRSSTWTPPYLYLYERLVELEAGTVNVKVPLELDPPDVTVRVPLMVSPV